jgi:hypothetical protein
MHETDIVQMSKDFMAEQVRELAGDEDPQAFQVLRDENDTLGIALVQIPSNANDRDKMADYLTAACCVHRACEATFSSAAWSSLYSDITDMGKAMPAQRPNRVEVVTLIHVTAERVETHTAAILRVAGKVKLSPWLSDSIHGEQVDGGRIPEALRWGIKLAGEMPQDLIDALTNARDVLPLSRVVELFVNQISEIRETHRTKAETN